MQSYFLISLLVAAVLSAPITQECSNHGQMNTATRACTCEEGFTGPQCEKVVLQGQMLQTQTQDGVTTPVTACTVKVYGNKNINSNENLLGETACSNDGKYVIVVDHQDTYVISAVNQAGTEARRVQKVPTTQEARRLRRSDSSSWASVVLTAPSTMYAEQWYAIIFWGSEHTTATNNIDLFLRGPWNGGCTAGSNYNKYGCKLTGYTPVTDHSIQPSIAASTASASTYGMESFNIFEIGTSQNFEIFTWNPDYINANYQKFRVTGGLAASTFAQAALYRADTSGSPLLVSSVDLESSSQSSLSNGTYWHIWSLTVNTPSANINQFLPGAGVVTVRNTVSCSPLAMVGSNSRQPWESATNNFNRGPNCPKAV